MSSPGTDAPNPESGDIGYWVDQANRARADREQVDRMWQEERLARQRAEEALVAAQARLDALAHEARRRRSGAAACRHQWWVHDGSAFCYRCRTFVADARTLDAGATREEVP